LNGVLYGLSKFLPLPISSSGSNGIEWKSLLENKLNKHFDWDEVFKTAFAKKEGITLEQVTVLTMFCK